MQTKALITYLAQQLDDEGFDFWERHHLLRVLNEVRNRLPYALPECTGSYGTFPIKAGALQTLKADTVSSIIRVEGVLDANGKLIAGLTERALLDVEASNPDWLIEDSDCGQFWVKHPNDKRGFWLYPAINQPDLSVNVFYSAMPPRVTDDDESELLIDDAYETNIIDFVLARAYEREGTSPDKVSLHMQKALGTLNMSASIDAKDNPRG